MITHKPTQGMLDTARKWAASGQRTADEEQAFADGLAWATEVLMGQCLAVQDVAQGLDPPPGMSARRALDVYAAIVDEMNRREFGEWWDPFCVRVRSVHGPAGAGGGARA